MTKRTKRVSVCEKDQQYLLTIEGSRTVKHQEQPAHYKDKVVVKPWGCEFLVFENECVAVWFLRIGKDHATSMHCHPSKQTSLNLLSGKALCNTFRHRNFLSAGDSLILDAGVFHSTKAMSLDGIFLIEVETPPDKLDLIRLEDNYGREDFSYEGHNQMTTDNLSDFDYFQLKQSQCSTKRQFTLDNHFSVSIDTYATADVFEESFAVASGSLYCVCKGELLGPDGSVVVDVGDIEKGAYIEKQGDVRIGEETVLMKFVVFD